MLVGAAAQDHASHREIKLRLDRHHRARRHRQIGGQPVVGPVRAVHVVGRHHGGADGLERQRRPGGERVPGRNGRIARAKAIADRAVHLGQPVGEDFRGAAGEAAQRVGGGLLVGGRDLDPDAMAGLALYGGGQHGRRALQHGGITGLDLQQMGQRDRWHIGEGEGHPHDGDRPGAAEEEQGDEEQHRGAGQDAAGPLVGLAIAQDVHLDLAPLRQPAVDIGLGKGAGIGGRRKLQVVDQMVVQLWKSLLNAGRHRLGRGPPPAQALHPPDGRARGGPDEQAQQPASDRPVLREVVGQREHGQGQQQARGAAHQVQLGAPAGQAAADGVQFAAQGGERVHWIRLTSTSSIYATPFSVSTTTMYTVR